MKLLELLRSRICHDANCQARVKLNTEVAEDYRDSLRAGCRFPPIVVFHDGKAYWLADGWHRDLAHEMDGRKTILADVREGTLRDAILYAVSANLKIGLRPDREDREKAARLLLGDTEWSHWADSEIARRCGCSRGIVAQLRHQLTPPDEKASEPRRRERVYTTKHGTQSKMNTSRIGGRRKQASTPAPTAEAVEEARQRKEAEWVREAREGMERSRRALVCLGERYRPVHSLLVEAIRLVG